MIDKMLSLMLQSGTLLANFKAMATSIYYIQSMLPTQWTETKELKPFSIINNFSSYTRKMWQADCDESSPVFSIHQNS